MIFQVFLKVFFPNCRFGDYRMVEVQRSWFHGPKLSTFLVVPTSLYISVFFFKHKSSNDPLSWYNMYLYIKKQKKTYKALKTIGKICFGKFFFWVAWRFLSLALSFLTKYSIFGKIKAEIYNSTLEMSIKLVYTNFILHFTSS